MTAEAFDLGAARKRIVDAELLARRALAAAGETRAENDRLRRQLAHALSHRADCSVCDGYRQRSDAS